MLPKNRPTHPGEFIREDILKKLSVTEKELAKAIGVSPETISRIINEEERISADMALRLGRFTKTTPEMWLNLQAAVDLWDACHSQHFEEIRKIEPYAA
ncbi:HigA family addiction module antitoxin [Desulfonema magnum]|uniref:Toxin-antitoxin system, antitoxin component n=1 Tax=Desulfonema magnum TaxID=45655 RepID=A0A975BT88_9BACT|nr:HigA family addiction module antitoxin [Desulfonema magnum]QTA90819.1 Toxin-antitoxin system, antitoxin component [Desulfonema magnum]